MKSLPFCTTRGIGYVNIGLVSVFVFHLSFHSHVSFTSKINIKNCLVSYN